MPNLTYSVRHEPRKEQDADLGEDATDDQAVAGDHQEHPNYDVGKSFLPITQSKSGPSMSSN